jgi:hypothetical protein
MATCLIRRSQLLLAVLLVFGSVPLTGCNQGVRRIPVSGEVTLDGKPLQGGVLLFHPDESKANTARASCTGPVKDGRYTLVTSGVTRAETGSGAPLGWYKVTLINDLPGTPVIEVHSKYLRPETTPVAIEIVDNPEPGAYDVKLTTK